MSRWERKLKNIRERGSDKSTSLPSKKEITERLYTGAMGELDGNIKETIKKLINHYDDYFNAGYYNIVISLGEGDDDYPSDYVIYGTRAETDEEYNTRCEKYKCELTEKQQRELEKKNEVEEIERSLYEKLKLKYGD